MGSLPEFLSTDRASHVDREPLGMGFQIAGRSSSGSLGTRDCSSPSSTFSAMMSPERMFHCRTRPQSLRT